MRNLWQKLGTLPSLLVGLGLIVLGTAGLQRIVNQMWPFDVERLDLVRAVAQDRADAPALLEAAYNEVILAFLAAAMLVIMGLFLPLIHYLNKRFAPQHLSFFAVLRQTSWVGIWGAFCVWLQMNRALGLAVALLVATVFVLFEILLQVRQRATQIPLAPTPRPSSSPPPS